MCFVFVTSALHLLRFEAILLLLVLLILLELPGLLSDDISLLEVPFEDEDVSDTTLFSQSSVKLLTLVSAFNDKDPFFNSILSSFTA